MCGWLAFVFLKGFGLDGVVRVLLGERGGGNDDGGVTPLPFCLLSCHCCCAGHPSAPVLRGVCRACCRESPSRGPFNPSQLLQFGFFCFHRPLILMKHTVRIMASITKPSSLRSSVPADSSRLPVFHASCLMLSVRSVWCSLPSFSLLNSPLSSAVSTCAPLLPCPPLFSRVNSCVCSRACVCSVCRGKMVGRGGPRHRQVAPGR